MKWAGGKRSLIPALARHFPDRVGHYWEPFIGGGAVFFTFADRIDRATISDANEDLILTYLAVKNELDKLVSLLRDHADRHFKEKGYYKKVRSQCPICPVEIAARFIYLNKTCYNGLYRVNKSGKFNVPEGKYKNPNICDEERLRAAHNALQKADIKVGDFSRIVSPRRGDFIYCDPPYDECFTSYQAGGFGEKDQERLKDIALKWKAMGATTVLSNADTPLIRKLYNKRKFAVHEASAPRNINRNGNGRGAANEVIAVAN